MIKTFKHKGLHNFFERGHKKGVQPKRANKLALILDLLDAAHNITDMNFPDSNLHLLEPKKHNVWAVKVSGNWRVIFRFEDGDAYRLDYKDYQYLLR